MGDQAEAGDGRHEDDQVVELRACVFVSAVRGRARRMGRAGQGRAGEGRVDGVQHCESTRSLRHLCELRRTIGADWADWMAARF